MKTRLLSRCLAIMLSAALGLLAGLTPTAFAKGKKPAAAKSAPADAEETPEAKIQGEIVIEGKIQKPEAFYVLQKSGINYDWNELTQPLVPKILDSVTKAPF